MDIMKVWCLIQRKTELKLQSRILESESLKKSKVMFKGKLIENESYYKLRKEHALYILIPSCVVGYLFNNKNIDFGGVIGVAIPYLILLYFSFRNARAIAKVSSKNIEIDKNQIRILDEKFSLSETIELNHETVIKLREEYRMADTMKDAANETFGKIKEHFIVVEHNAQERRFDFELNSYFMIERLNSLIDLWKKDGYKVEYL